MLENCGRELAHDSMRRRLALAAQEETAIGGGSATERSLGAGEEECVDAGELRP
jgi:hypothetical protein